MDQDQFTQACSETLRLIRRYYAGKAFRVTEEPTSAPHICWMLGEASQFYAQDKREKANRWLGWAQCAANVGGMASLEELKRANMPEGAEFSSERV